jgi:hypothetical protein
MAGARIPAAQVKQEQQANLAGKLVWADKKKGTVERLPLDQAIRLTVAEGGKRKPNAAGSQPTAGPSAAGSATEKKP